MKVLEIELSGFMSSAPTLLRLPRTGVVVVTGENGAGKSTFIEGVSVALFGKTLRGTPWWPSLKSTAEYQKSKSSACVTTDVVVARRTRTSKTDLVWSINEDEPAGRVARSSGLLSGVAPEDAAPTKAITYETATQAQAALEELVGTHDAWRRTSAFSSADAAHFSSSSDGERKRLLEGMLGLERFDAALEKCRESLRAAEKAFTESNHKLNTAALQVEHKRDLLAKVQAELARAQEVVPAEPAPVPLGGSTEDLEVSLRAAHADFSAAEKAHAAAVRAHARTDLLVTQGKQAVQQFKLGECPTCGQGVADLCEEREAALAAAVAKHAESTEIECAMRADLEDARWLLNGLTRKYEASQATRREADATMTRRNQALRRVKQVEGEVAAALTTVDQVEREEVRAVEDVEDRRKRVLVLKAAEVALGLRGFRAHVLAKSLAGLNAVANAWLPRLGNPNLKVSLRPYTEKKSGGVTDSISLDIEGAGDGYGYQAASGGERRRVDVAILLALAEVGQAAAGLTGSTLFLDEVFDALDERGVAALTYALDELARDRCVVLVSNRPDVIQEVRAAVRVHVVDGVATVTNAAGSSQGGLHGDQQEA